MNRLLYPLLAAITLTGCQHSVLERLHPIPVVSVQIKLPVDITGKSDMALPHNHRVYLYPQFDYAAETILLDAVDNAGQVSLLPGNYRVVVHSLPLEPLVLSGTESFETVAVTLAPDATGHLPSCPMFYALKSKEPMKSVEVVRTDLGENSLVFQPILITKRLRFEINVSNFGNITSVRGSLTGVASTLNLNTLKTTMGRTILFNKVTVVGDKLVFEAFDVLGFTAENPDDVVLTIFVRNDEVDFELEQPVDLTEEIKRVEEEGGDLDINIDLKFDPDIRIHPVSIRQWDEAGNEIELGFK